MCKVFRVITCLENVKAGNVRWSKSCQGNVRELLNGYGGVIEVSGNKSCQRETVYCWLHVCGYTVYTRLFQVVWYPGVTCCRPKDFAANYIIVDILYSMYWHIVLVALTMHHICMMWVTTTCVGVPWEAMKCQGILQSLEVVTLVLRYVVRQFIPFVSVSIW